MIYSILPWEKYLQSGFLIFCYNRSVIYYISCKFAFFSGLSRVNPMQIGIFDFKFLEISLTKFLHFSNTGHPAALLSCRCMRVLCHQHQWYSLPPPPLSPPPHNFSMEDPMCKNLPLTRDLWKISMSKYWNSLNVLVMGFS